MCKQLKEKLSQTFMSSMKSMIDMLDEHSKSIKKLEQRINQLSAKGSGAEGNKNIKFTIESPTFEDLEYYNAEDGEYCKFLDTEHPDAHIVAILKKVLQDRGDGNVLCLLGTRTEWQRSSLYGRRNFVGRL